MTHRSRNSLAALLAAGLLVVSTLSGTALARNPGNPHFSAAPQASLMPSHPAKPVHSMKPQASAHGAAAMDCGKLQADASAAPDASSTAPAMHKPNITVACALAAQQAAADKKIDKLIASLQDLRDGVSKLTSLAPTDQAGLLAEIDAAIADLQALRAKIDAETTVSGVQADRKALTGKDSEIRAIEIQVRVLAGLESVLSETEKLDAQAVALTTQLAAAPSGIDTVAAQRYLDDMKANIAAAKALAAPIPAELLALTPAQLQAGRSTPVLAEAFADLIRAGVDNLMARIDARIVTWILAGMPGFQGHNQSPTAAPSALAPTSTESPAPTATPV